MDGTQTTVLLVDSDPGINGRIERAAEGAAWQLRLVQRIGQLEGLLNPGRADVAILPSADGSTDVTRRLVRTYPSISVVIWSLALSSEQIADLLEAGAADVLTARMSSRELAARIARCARTGAAFGSSERRIGTLHVDTFHGIAEWEGTPLGLTGRELDMLDVLCGDVGVTLRREVIYRRVWGHNMARGDRNVDVTVKRLREKLQTATGHAVAIETVPGVGYRLEVSAAAQDGNLRKDTT